MFRISAFFVLVLILASFGCSDEHGESPVAYSYQALSTPEDLEAEPGSESISLTWNHSGEYREFIVYILYYSGTEMVHQPVDTTASTSSIIGDLVPNLEYCFSVSAVDSSGMEGWRSDEVCAVAHSN
ncbi:MAG: hypothetical protein GF417_03340 [Candidatus Latescibacteria bacterium]|nr:hypothetical protein [bacterium]MBD3423462.1 hypothetical protein [Candidatus Latescibacterota bacterium]